MKKFSRRSFLLNAGLTVSASTAAVALPLLFTKQKRYTGKKLNIALVGLGRYAGISQMVFHMPTTATWPVL
jgi:hypothetical protein